MNTNNSEPCGGSISESFGINFRASKPTEESKFGLASVVLHSLSGQDGEGGEGGI